MSWRERDYSRYSRLRERAGQWGLRPPSRGALALIVLHVVAALMVAILRSGLESEPVARWALSEHGADPLAVVLHPLAGAGLLTLLLNVIIIWSLGGLIEQRFGAGWLLALYAGGNLAAGTAAWLVARSEPALSRLAVDYPIGALGAWGGWAWSALRGEYGSLVGRVMPVSTMILLAGAVLVVPAMLFYQFGCLAWLAGAMTGAALGLAAHRLSVSLPARTGRWRRRRPSVRPSVGTRPPTEALEDEELDRLLAKIARQGLTSLTSRERRRLEDLRQARLRRDRRSRNQASDAMEQPGGER